MLVKIIQNGKTNPSKNSRESLFDVVDEKGTVIGKVTSMKNVTTSMGNISIEIKLNVKEKENGK